MARHKQQSHFNRRESSAAPIGTWDVKPWRGDLNRFRRPGYAAG